MIQYLKEMNSMKIVDMKFKVNKNLTIDVEVFSALDGQKRSSEHKNVKNLMSVFMTDFQNKTYNFFDILDAFKAGLVRSSFSPSNKDKGSHEINLGKTKLYINNGDTLLDVFARNKMVASILRELTDSYAEYMVKELEIAVDRHMGIDKKVKS